MQSILLETKKHIYRATSIIFMFQLFGALGAGLIFVVSNVLQVEILSPENPLALLLWHIFFWATDFFFIGFTVILAYLIAGLPALAPAMTLAIYFAHFAGQYSGNDFATPMYYDFFATPALFGGGVNIGYIGYLFLAVLLGWIIKYLFSLWDKIKKGFSKKLDILISKLGKKVNPLKNIRGITILEAVDLIVLFLILPISAAVFTYFAVSYIVAAPFTFFAENLKPVLFSAYESSSFLGGLLSGAMVGFDIIGPFSMSAFSVASELALEGNAVPMTAYALCFAVIGWIPLVSYFLGKLMKKGGKLDTDDLNIVMSGPINAFFDNMKLTVSFSMTFAYRSPISCITAYVAGGAFAGGLVALAGLANALYVTAEKTALFLNGEIYISFLQPLRSISSTPMGILLPVFGAIGAISGACVLVFIKEISARRQKKRNISFEPSGDMVVEIRKLAESYNIKGKMSNEDIQVSDVISHP